MSPELARILRARGFDVTTAHELGTQALDDERQLEYATSDGRTILTFNFVHFLRLGDSWYAAGREHAGIVVSYRQYARRRIGDLARATTALLNQVSAEEIRN